MITHCNYTHFITLVRLAAVILVKYNRGIIWVTSVLMIMKKLGKNWEKEIGALTAPQEDYCQQQP